MANKTLTAAEDGGLAIAISTGDTLKIDGTNLPAASTNQASGESLLAVDATTGAPKALTGKVLAAVVADTAGSATTATSAGDADTLDGQHAAAFLTAVPDPIVPADGTQGITGNLNLGSSARAGTGILEVNGGVSNVAGIDVRGLTGDSSIGIDLTNCGLTGAAAYILKAPNNYYLRADGFWRANIFSAATQATTPKVQTTGGNLTFETRTDTPNNFIFTNQSNGTVASISSAGALAITGNLKLPMGGKILPASDSTTAMQFAQADGTAFLTLDTTNKRVGIGVAPSAEKLAIEGTTDAVIRVGQTSGLSYNTNMRFGYELNSDRYNGISFYEGTTRKGGFFWYSGAGMYMDLAAARDFSVRNASYGGTTLLFIKQSTGNIGFRTTDPTAKIHIAAGTATAGTAPIKLTAGTNLGTPEAGAVEWDGTNLFVTQSDGTRKTIAYV